MRFMDMSTKVIHYAVDRKFLPDGKYGRALCYASLKYMQTYIGVRMNDEYCETCLGLLQYAEEAQNDRM